MACDIISTRGALFVLWGAPTTGDVDRLIQSLSVAVEQAGEPVVFVARVPVAQPPPSTEVRRHMAELMPKFLPLLSSYHVVLEGAGFASAVKRAILISLFQLTWRRERFFVHANIQEVHHSLEPKLHPAVHGLFDLAKSRGLLDATGPILDSAPAAVAASMPR
jgi:hypothetical protein